MVIAQATRIRVILRKTPLKVYSNLNRKIRKKCLKMVELNLLSTLHNHAQLLKSLPELSVGDRINLV